MKNHSDREQWIAHKIYDFLDITELHHIKRRVTRNIINIRVQLITFSKAIKAYT